MTENSNSDDKKVQVNKNALAVLKSNAEADLQNVFDGEHAERLENAVEKAEEALSNDE